MLEKREPTPQETGMCPHGNFPDSCVICNQEKESNYDEFLKKAEETLTPEDFTYLRQFLEKTGKEGRGLFIQEGKFLHTTNDFNFEEIVSSGNIRTKSKQEGIYGTRGASFTDGNFEKAICFQSIFDDQNTRSEDKRFNSEKYTDKVDEFLHYFWDDESRREELKIYLSKIGGGKKIETFDDAKAVAESFKFKAKPKEISDDEERLSRLYGVTIVFNKDKLPDITQEGTEGIQRYFEHRSYREEGVPISEASTIFVPEVKIDDVRKQLNDKGLSHIEIRPSEELEVIRLMRINSESEGGVT